MNPARRNHPCGRKEQAGDESERKKSSLLKKEQAGDESERNPGGRDNPC